MNDVIRFVEEGERFAICSHISPDGDTLGCALSLYLGLQKMGKQCTLHCKSTPSSYYQFMPYINQIQPLEEIPDGADVICVDCADLKRAALPEDNDYHILNIDHHISNTNFGAVNLVEPKAAATAEMIFDLLNELDIPVDEEMATCMYIGICTDTSNYTNSNVTGHTFEIAAKLMELGVNVNKVTKQLFRTRPWNKTKAIAKTIDHMELHYDGFVSTSYLTYQDLQDLKLDDAEGLVNYASDLAGVDIAIFIKESKPGICKFSLRSNGITNVQEICAVFGGGGHIRAAGCIMEGVTVEQAKEKMLAEVHKWMA